MFLDLTNEPFVLHKLAEVWFTLLCITRSCCRNQLCNLTPPLWFIRPAANSDTTRAQDRKSYLKLTHGPSESQLGGNTNLLTSENLWGGDTRALGVYYDCWLLSAFLSVLMYQQLRVVTWRRVQHSEPLCLTVTGSRRQIQWLPHRLAHWLTD